MKIEKIDENKIRIILKQEDFKDKTINIQKLLMTTPESQSLFLEILDKAEKELNFNTNGHKLFIEVFFQSDDSYIFTITKYIESNVNIKNKPKKYLNAKRKSQSFNIYSAIYEFCKFEDFCDFCTYIYNNSSIELKNLYKNCFLYFYNDTFYLIINGFNLSHKSLRAFHSSLVEFSSLLKYSENFSFKLKEHGKLILKNNAINLGIKYFA